MFRLTNKLAVSNLIKTANSTIPLHWLFSWQSPSPISLLLTFNPKIAEIRGGTTIQATLDLVCLLLPLRQPLSSSMPIVLS